MRSRLAVAGMLIMMLVVIPAPARADGSWLDAPLIRWNSPGMPMPQAPPADASLNDSRCLRVVRPPETAEDSAVTNAGWTLFGAAQSGWGIRIISGEAAVDGMCRPADYQVFVFVDGIFAGTISPVSMSARSDGAAVTESITFDGAGVTAHLARYNGTEPLCCPSRTSDVTYRIDRTGAAPVLLPDSVSTRSVG